jgi:predicted N-acetyltransferase YhbS
VHEAAFGRPDEARLAARLRQEASPLVSLVAEERGRVIAHVLFSPVTLEGDATPAGALAPVGVLPDAQGRGAGTALIRAGIAACRSLDWRLLFVLGAPAYYGRFGFMLAAPRGLHYASHAFDVAWSSPPVRSLVQRAGCSTTRHSPSWADRCRTQRPAAAAPGLPGPSRGLRSDESPSRDSVLELHSHSSSTAHATSASGRRVTAQVLAVCPFSILS